MAIKYAKISRDLNGNKIVSLKFSNGTGFSIQTNGNLPQTHKLHPGKISPTDVTEFVEPEVKEYVRKYGTSRQKSIMGESVKDIIRRIVKEELQKENKKVRKIDKRTADKYNIEKYPNFHKSGSISGMKKMYYGKDALLVKYGNYIYNVSDNPDIYESGI